MTTYPISEPEMEQISSLNAQVTVRFSVASLLLGLSASIWTNAIFVTEMTAAGQLASYYLAPILLVFAAGYAVAGYLARRNRASAWEKIKSDAIPVRTVAEATGLIVSSNRPAGQRRQGGLA
jgi:hypothetical protein